MKTLIQLRVAIFLFFSFAGSLTSFAQQFLTQVNSWNAYIHLPANYNNTTQKYPTIIYFPGLNHSGTNASLVIETGPGAYIAQGWNGNIAVDGSTVEFIVISLQPSSYFPNEYLMNQRIQTLKSQYRIDSEKLYLVGFSAGGWCASTFVTGDPYGGPYNYASQIAAVVTVLGMKPDDNQPYPNLFDNFAMNGGKYLGFEQRNDGRDTRTVVNRMNVTSPGSAFYVQTNFSNGGHCCESEYFGGEGKTPGNFSINGITQNLYQWLARLSLGTTTPANQSPVANAGSDRSVTLPSNSVSISGSGSDPDGTIISYLWTKVSGPSGGIISNANTANTLVSGLNEGVYDFQLRVTDNNNATATDIMRVFVNPAPAGNQPPTANAGSDASITLPANSISLNGSGSDPDGSIVSYSWVKTAGPSAGSISYANTAQATASGLVEGIYTFELTVTDNQGAVGSDVMMITVYGNNVIGKNIRVNVFNGSNAYSNSQWNNWNTLSGLNSSNFKYEDGTQSTVSASLNTQAGVADNGSNYATSANVCPSQILRHNSYNTSYRHLIIKGLNPSKKYLLEFFGSRANSGNKTVFNIGNLYDTISTDHNVNDFAKFEDIQPATNGNVIVYLISIGTYNYMAGFNISESVAGRSGTGITYEPVRTASSLDELQTNLKVYPNPFIDLLKIEYPNLNNEFNIIITDIACRTVFQKRISNNTTSLKETINTTDLKEGIYFLTIMDRNGKITRQLLKQ